MVNQRRADTHNKRNRSGKEKKTNRWNLSWRRVIYLLLVAYLCFTFLYLSYSVLDLKSQEADLIEQAAKEAEYREELEKQIAYLSTDEAVERAAREELGYVKPDEVLIHQKTEEEASGT